MPKSKSQELPRFGIGAVSRLTGIPMDTLRIWERRYEVVTPVREGSNRRFYSKDDISKLLLIKQLVDQGNPISSVVHLQESALKARLSSFEDLEEEKIVSREESASIRKVRVVVLGEVLPFQLKAWSSDMPHLEVVGVLEGLDQLESVFNDIDFDLLVLECPAVQSSEWDLIRRIGEIVSFSRLLLIYGFIPKTIRSQLEELGVAVKKAPVAATDIEDFCYQQLLNPHKVQEEDRRGDALEARPRRYSGESLAKISTFTSSLECECPRHLVDLLARLSAFERYSATCESRSAEDAALHGSLYRFAGKARTLIEEAMDLMVTVEGIPLDPP